MTTLPPGALIADHAHNALTPGPCAQCRHGVHIGQRIARLATGEWCHAWCAAAVVPPRSTPARA